jgi:hypothetical protein
MLYRFQVYIFYVGMQSAINVPVLLRLLDNMDSGLKYALEVEYKVRWGRN